MSAGALIVAGAMVAVLLAPAMPGYGQALDLKSVPAGQQVRAVRYCQAHYEVALADGSLRQVKEYDLSFKSDAGPRGPHPARPVLIPQGRLGDRFVVVVFRLVELRTLVGEAC